MSLRSTLAFLAVTTILGGAAFYSLGLSNKVKEDASATERERTIVASSADAQASDMNALSPAAGQAETEKEDSAASKEQTKVTADQAPDKTDSTSPEVTKSPTEILASQDLQLSYGKPDAPVTVIEYFSLSCPHCAHFYAENQPKLTKDYVDTGKVYYIMRYFPHNGPGLAATMLMQCVEEDKKESFLAALFNMQDKWAFTQDFKKNLMSIAQIGGMGPTDYEQCLTDKSIEDRVLSQRQEAMDGLKIDGIPTFFVNGNKLDGYAYSRLTEVIDKELLIAGE